MRGRLIDRKWHVTPTGGHFYLAQRIVNGETETREYSSHCLACAKADILAKKGGEVDTRGWHRQGSCGLFLLAMVGTVREETEAA